MHVALQNPKKSECDTDSSDLFKSCVGKIEHFGRGGALSAGEVGYIRDKLEAKSGDGDICFAMNNQGKDIKFRDCYSNRPFTCVIDCSAPGEIILVKDFGDRTKQLMSRQL